MQLRFYCILFFFLATGVSAQVRFEVGAGYLRNNYYIADDYNRSSYISGGGFTAGVKFSHFFSHSNFMDGMLGLMITNYRAEIYSHFPDMAQTDGYDSARVNRMDICLQILPFKFEKKRIKINAGVQINQMLFNSTIGSSRYHKSGQGHVWSVNTRYNKDTLHLNSPTTAGLALSISFKTINIGQWELRPRYGLYYGILSDFGTGGNFHPLRNSLELTLSKSL